VTRFLLTNAVYRLVPPTDFPYGTLVVNVTGCLAIGFLGKLGEGRVALT
jgi:fluoride ion exporter CrcB/FEX